jgi:hypothetical protein
VRPPAYPGAVLQILVGSLPVPVLLSKIGAPGANYRIGSFRHEFSLCINLNDLASYSEELTDKIRRNPSEILPLFEEAAREVADEVSLDFFQTSHIFRFFEPGWWIRIRIGSGFSDFVDPDPYWKSKSGSRGKKIQWKNTLFSYLKKFYH